MSSTKLKFLKKTNCSVYINFLKSIFYVIKNYPRTVTECARGYTMLLGKIHFSVPSNHGITIARWLKPFESDTWYNLIYVGPVVLKYKVHFDLPLHLNLFSNSLWAVPHWSDHPGKYFSKFDIYFLRSFTFN